MADPVSSITSVAASTGYASQMRPGGADAAREADTRSFFDMFDSGIDRLSQRPQPGGEVSAVDQISGAYGGDVGAAKVDMMSAEDLKNDPNQVSEGTSLENRLTNLYFELTHYQVAWRIVQNVQRDLSQVLRGS